MSGAAGVAGLVLAGGRGVRFGGPKALATDGSGRSWLALAAEALHVGGLRSVTVVVPPGIEELLPDDARAFPRVVAPAPSEGLSTSLRAGLAALAEASAVLVTLVDLPGLPAAAVARVLGDEPGPRSLRRAVYHGAPGHPVLIGRDHRPALLAGLTGDSGAGGYLASAGAVQVECGDLFDGRDVDRR